ncbi:hypothetical protein [Gordonia soli]|nr:hypothetical protein [Gordonia soli]
MVALVVVLVPVVLMIVALGMEKFQDLVTPVSPSDPSLPIVAEAPQIETA